MNIVQRNNKGQFLSGHKQVSPGRPRGSRNRHTENFLAAFCRDFELHGPDVIAKVREEQPAVYLKIASDLLPRHAELSVDVDIHAEVVALQETFRDVNGGRVDRELEKMAKRLLPGIINAEPERE
jgi:hypothetical protein